MSKKAARNNMDWKFIAISSLGINASLIAAICCVAGYAYRGDLKYRDDKIDGLSKQLEQLQTKRK